MITEIIEAGKAAIDAISDAVIVQKLKAMCLEFEKEIHRLSNLIGNLITQLKHVQDQLKVRDKENESLKVQVFELLRYKESHIRKEN